MDYVVGNVDVHAELSETGVEAYVGVDSKKSLTESNH